MDTAGEEEDADFEDSRAAQQGTHPPADVEEEEVSLSSSAAAAAAGAETGRGKKKVALGVRQAYRGVVERVVPQVGPCWLMVMVRGGAWGILSVSTARPRQPMPTTPPP